MVLPGPISLGSEGQPRSYSSVGIAPVGTLSSDFAFAGALCLSPVPMAMGYPSLQNLDGSSHASIALLDRDGILMVLSSTAFMALGEDHQDY